MGHDEGKVLEYWNRPDVESMYDKHLLSAEISLIRARIPPGTKILNAGCGEGEGTAFAAGIADVDARAVIVIDIQVTVGDVAENLSEMQAVTCDVGRITGVADEGVATGNLLYTTG